MIKKCKKSRKLSYIVLVIIGVSITPPDFISDFLIIAPMILLFEVSILIASSIERKEKKKQLQNSEVANWTLAIFFVVFEIKKQLIYVFFRIHDYLTLICGNDGKINSS